MRILTSPANAGTVSALLVLGDNGKPALLVRQLPSGILVIDPTNTHLAELITQAGFTLPDNNDREAVTRGPTLFDP